MSSLAEEARTIARALEAWGDARSWIGPDPYEALNARRLPEAIRRSRRGAQAAIQVVKRLPFDPRRMLAIAPHENAAALAQVASAYARNGFLPADDAAQKLNALLARVLALRSPGFTECCWGYHFDVQTRVFFYPRQAPNTIATSFAGNAFLDAYEAVGDRALLDVAQSTGEYFLAHVPQTPREPGAYFGYLVDDRTPIHNANLLVCALLARLYRHTQRTEFRDACERGIVYTVERQHPNGSWYYGELPHLRWVDNYHTGYVLEALLVCHLSGMEVDLDAWRRGVAYYESELFRDDGAPRYFSTSLYPIDIQCVAQGIQTFARASSLDGSWLQASIRVYRYALTCMRRHDGAFAFQRRRFWRNDIPHVRWGEAPMLHALTRLIEHAGSS